MSPDQSAAQPGPRFRRGSVPPILDIAPEVAQALGAASVMRLRAETDMTEYICCICGRPSRLRRDVDGTAEASVIATRYTGGVTVARLAHPQCSPSALLNVLGAPTLRQHAVRAACCLVTTAVSPSTPRAVLLLRNDIRAWPRRLAGQAEDHFSRALTAAGFAPLRTLDDLDDLQPRPGLTATISQEGKPGVRVSRAHSTVFDGTPEVPDAWRKAAEADDQLAVLAGTALPGPSTAPRAIGATTDLITDLKAAIAAGRVFVAVATVVEHVDAGGISQNDDFLPRNASETWPGGPRKAG
jgi:hypothetical protein